MNILSSASKIVLLMLTFTSCVAFLMKILPVEFFVPMVMAVFGFYFANKGTPEQPYAGK